MAKKIEPNELLSELAHFTGTTQWYRNPMFPKFLFTDGVKYLAEKAECYWLIDYIFSYQLDSQIQGHEFQVWKIFVADNKATIKVEDGNDNLIKEMSIPYTDFPLPEFTLWFSEGVLLLKSEY